MPTLLIRYGEIGLKSASVRRRFENSLVQDIRRKHVLAQLPCLITSTRGRIYVDSDDWRRSCELLSRTFGIVSFSPATRVASEQAQLTKDVVAFSEPLLCEGATFAVRARRTGNHPYTSQTLAGDLGAALLDAYGGRGIKVRLDDPDVEIFVEVRDRQTYLFSSTFPGPGGMPKGTQGKVLSVLDSPNGLASSWLLMKRGCTVVACSDDERLIEGLRAWDADLKTSGCDGDVFDIARRHDCIGLVLPWRLDDLETRKPLKGDLPVFYPLVGMNDDEVRVLMERVRP
jgi:thiamine biosynthesis protein ThiI